MVLQRDDVPVEPARRDARAKIKPVGGALKKLVELGCEEDFLLDMLDTLMSHTFSKIL